MNAVNKLRNESKAQPTLKELADQFGYQLLGRNRTTEEVAEFLHCSPATVSIWRTQGAGPRFIHVGRLVRYTEPDLLAWLYRNNRGLASVQTTEVE